MITRPLAEVRNQLSAAVDDVARTHERIAITRNGRVVAILIAPDDLDALEFTLEELDSEPYRSAVLAVKAQEDADERVPAGQVREGLEAMRRAQTHRPVGA
jgi:antitoxin YefM